jgi:hypothetical protein
MATTYKGDYKTIADNPTPATILDPGSMGGNVRVMFDTVTFATATGLPIVGDIVELGAELPVGARVLDIMFWCSDASTTFTIGDYEDVDRYHAGTTANTLEHMEAYAGMGYEVDMTTASTPDNQIIATAATATITTGSVIKFWITYAID